MKILVTILACLLYSTGVSGQDCSAEGVQSAYKECLNQFISTYYTATANGTGSAADCSQARTEGMACVNNLVTQCSDQLPQLTKIVSPTEAERAFQFACDSSDDVALANRCYRTVNSSSGLRTCEQTKREELSQLRQLDNNATTEQTLCLWIDAHSSCLRSNLASQCQAQSPQFITFLNNYFPTDCAVSTSTPSKESEEKSKCGDDAVMVNFTACVKPFFERINKIELDKKKCNESILETLKCVATIVDKCAKENFQYIQQLLDLGRMKTALDFGCARNWELSKGAFCYNKHYGSDIKPCLDKKMASQRTYASDNEKSFETVCRYIDDTTDCTRSGMETCKDEAVTFTEYVRIFFPRDCTDDKGSAPALSAVIGLVTSLVLAQLLL